MKQMNVGVFIAILALVSAGAFYGGMQYQKTKIPSPSLEGRSFTGETRTGAFGNRMPNGGGQGGAGFVNGTVIQSDEQGITLKLNDGGSRIVLLSSSTQISKNAAGSMEDLVEGAAIMVTGTTNADGSMTAQTVQIRPAEGGDFPGFGEGIRREGLENFVPPNLEE